MLLKAGTVKNHLNGERDTFADGLGVGYDDGNERGEWSKRPQVIIPKLGEVALLLNVHIASEDENPPHL